MSLISRAVTTGTSLAWTSVLTDFTGAGYDMENMKGAIGKGLLTRSSLKSVASTVYAMAVQNLKNNIASIKTYFMEDLASQLLQSTVYSKLNSIEWSDTRLWEIRIDGLPKPFTGFAPINNASLSTIDVKLGTMNVGTTCWQYIDSQGTRSITVDIMDDVKGTMEEYLYNWMDEISGRKAYGVTPTEKAGRIIKFRKLSRGKFVTSQLNLYCVPEGTLRHDNNQSSARPRTISMNFAILGITRYVVQEQFPVRDMSQIAALASANLLRRNKYAYKLREYGIF